ncbi:hypothetical protein EYZ11_003929 [Aspergillus tanneri]|uniref:Short-chain dehydrogenase/reductase 3 n=1 Tax=Aspergillus tanneri TaxID=1220188 RepID=A0A4S3JLU8_9EURO|nr:hypothetical protein EYZ11_003929 [Aspergillus tanneri]
MSSSNYTKFLAALALLVFLGKTNSILSRWVANNWTSSDAWQPEREIAIVTGGSNGIGKQIATDLAVAGVRVIILDIHKPSSLPKNDHFYHADVTSSDGIRGIGKRIRAEYGGPTVLINNAGVGYPGSILEKPEIKIRRTFEINTISHFLLVREFLPAMVRQNHGHVVTIASMASFVVAGNMVEYACSKASALAFHEGLSQELKFYYNAPKVRTIVIHPIWVRTEMIKPLDLENSFQQTVLAPEMVSQAVVRQVITQKSGQVILPQSHISFSAVRALPSWLQEKVRNIASQTLKTVRE